MSNRAFSLVALLIGAAAVVASVALVVQSKRRAPPVPGGTAAEAAWPEKNGTDIDRSDDDGYDFSSPVKLPARPTADCGAGPGSLEARIADCSGKTGALAAWSAGESAPWRLVARAGDAEVWMDGRTHWLWSDDLTHGKKNANWCQAAGNHQRDPFNLCNSAEGRCSDAALADEAACVKGGKLWTPEIQSQKRPRSYCAERDDSGHRLYSPIGENYDAGAYDAAKGGLGERGSSARPAVHWRLPTLHDYEQAEVDGIRWILPHFGLRGGYISFWTGTIYSYSREGAWYFDSAGGVGSSPRNEDYGGVRCVGR